MEKHTIVVWHINLMLLAFLWCFVAGYAMTIVKKYKYHGLLQTIGTFLVIIGLIVNAYDGVEWHGHSICGAVLSVMLLLNLLGGYSSFAHSSGAHRWNGRFALVFATVVLATGVSKYNTRYSQSENTYALLIATASAYAVMISVLYVIRFLKSGDYKSVSTSET